MNDIRIVMQIKDGRPFTFELQVNGIPRARQNCNGILPITEGVWTVMLDERMGPDFKPPKYSDHPKELQ